MGFFTMESQVMCKVGLGSKSGESPSPELASFHQEQCAWVSVAELSVVRKDVCISGQ